MVSTYFLTFIITFALILIAMTLLGVGALITGEKRLRPNMCGKRPEKKSTCEKNASGCALCGSKNSCEKEGEDD